MRSPNFFAAAALDRVSHLRADPAWMRGALEAESSLFFPVWRSRNLVVEGEVPHAVALPRAEAQNLLEEAGEIVLLGVANGIAHFAVDLSPIEQPEQLPALAGRGAFADLRNIGALIGRDEGAALAYARGMVHWHQTHRFCGACGTPTETREGGHLRVCSSPGCGASHFPRTDPAVIMLVADGDRCVLGRKAEWAPGMYSTLAGFVEPGESLEDAVRREVREETGLEVADVNYHSSQPWPFPASLMLGFHCRAATDNIHLDTDELEDARWFTRAELKNGAGGMSRPRPISIARRLIDDWIAAG